MTNGPSRVALSCLAFTAFLSVSALPIREASANVIGSDTQNFNPTTDNLDFVTVQSSRTLQPGVFNLGLFFDDAINSLPYLTSGTQGLTQLNDHLVSSHFGAGVGLLPSWDFGIDIASVLAQTIEASQPLHGQFTATGLTEISANTKYRVWGNDDHGVALVGTVNFNETQNNPFTGIDPGPTWDLEVAGDWTIQPVRFALNIGHRWAENGTPVPGAPIQPLGDQIIASAAANYLIPHTDTKAVLELFGSRPDSHVDDNTDRLASSLELLLGLKHDFKSALSIHGGIGTGLIDGISSPSWRFYAGLTYAFGPVFAKNSMKFEVVKEENQERLITQRIEFDFDSAQLNPDAIKTLDEIVQFLKHANYKKIIVEGHTDSVGNDAYNLDLSQRRANAIRSHLIDHDHFEQSTLEAKGYGSTRPIADNGNFQGRQQNRRVEFRLEQ